MTCSLTRDHGWRAGADAHKLQQMRREVCWLQTRVTIQRLSSRTAANNGMKAQWQRSLAWTMLGCRRVAINPHSCRDGSNRVLVRHAGHLQEAAAAKQAGSVGCFHPTEQPGKPQTCCRLAAMGSVIVCRALRSAACCASSYTSSTFTATSVSCSCANECGLGGCVMQKLRAGQTNKK